MGVRQGLFWGWGVCWHVNRLLPIPPIPGCFHWKQLHVSCRFSILKLPSPQNHPYLCVLAHSTMYLFICLSSSRTFCTCVQNGSTACSIKAPIHINYYCTCTYITTVHVLILLLYMYLYYYCTCTYITTVHVLILLLYMYLYYYCTCTCITTVHVLVLLLYMYLYYYCTCTYIATVHVLILLLYMYLYCYCTCTYITTVHVLVLLLYMYLYY